MEIYFWLVSSIVTALTQEDADKAVAQLKSEGCDAKGTQLDQTDAASVAALAEYMKSNYGGVDSLVCNAGINYKVMATQFLMVLLKLLNLRQTTRLK